MNNKIIPLNMKDSLFAECKSKRQLENKIMELFSQNGYKEIMTPAIEFYDTFMSGKAMQPEEMYKFTDSKNRLVVLRPDSTIPIGRVLTTRLREAVYPLKLCYSQSVYRANSYFSGMRDEISECGIELIGVDSMKADIEAIVLASDSLRRAVGSSYKIEIGNVAYFNSLISELPLNEDEAADIRELISSKNFAALGTYLDKFDFDVSGLKALPGGFGDIGVVQEVKQSCRNRDALKALEYVEQLCLVLKSLGYGDNIIIDLGLINKMEYYTGVVFKGYIETVGEAVLSGGRYNSLFKGDNGDIPAVGFAVNLDAVNDEVMAISESRRDSDTEAVIYYGSGSAAAGYRLYKELEAKGVKAEIAVSDSLEETQEYARARSIGRIYSVTAEGTEILCAGGRGNEKS